MARMYKSYYVYVVMYDYYHYYGSKIISTGDSIMLVARVDRQSWKHDFCSVEIIINTSPHGFYYALGVSTWQQACQKYHYISNGMNKHVYNIVCTHMYVAKNLLMIIKDSIVSWE